MIVTATGVVRDDGSIVIFSGLDEDGKTVRFAADHRPAADIAEALIRGEEPQCDVAEWAIIARSI